MNISKLNKAEVLAVLYNNAKPLGMGILHYTPEDMTVEEAEKILQGCSTFDYLNGRVMKINLKSNELATGLYNRDNGPNVAERVLQPLIEKAEKQ